MLKNPSKNNNDNEDVCSNDWGLFEVFEGQLCSDNNLCKGGWGEGFPFCQDRKFHPFSHSLPLPCNCTNFACKWTRMEKEMGYQK